MSKEHLLDPGTQQEALRPVDEAYVQAVNQLEVGIPELAEKRAAIDVASKELIEDLDVEPAFFEDYGRALTFTSISERWSRLSKDEGDEASTNERHFLYDSLALLAREFSPKLSDAKDAIDSENDAISEKGRYDVYEKYTDKELSKAVTEKIKDGSLLASLKEKLGVTTDNEDDYEIHVLSVTSSENESNGLRAPQLDWENLPKDRAESKRISDEHEKLTQAVKQQQVGLVERGKKMAAELGRDDMFAPAWITKLDGKTLLCISMPLAEKITSPELTKDASYYSERDAQNDMAILEHEYTHTQGGVNVDHEINFGINLEELRAEFFSGNKQGYQDVKAFFQDYRLITGEHPTDAFQKRAKGGNVHEAFSDIANRVGLSSMLEVVMASPNNYIQSQSNVYSRATHNYLGGLDGVVERLLEQEILNGNGADIEKRIEQLAKVWIDVTTKPGAALDIDNLAAMRARHGLRTVTNLIAKKAHELGNNQPVEILA